VLGASRADVGKMNSGVRRLADLRREASAAARELQGGEDALDARELRVLLGVSSAVASASSLEELLDLAADQALPALGAHSVSVSRWESGAEILRTLVNAGHLAQGEARHPEDEIYRLSGDDPLKRLLLEGGSYVGLVDDPSLHPLERSLLERLGVRSCVGAPIMLGDAAWGELWATRPADQPDFGRRDERLLSAIAAQVAAGIARAELYGRMTTLAFEDGLTGLANRHALVERLDLALERGAEVALLLCDVDNLKALNQGRGHHGGDWALKAVAGALRMAAEGLPDALVCRNAGDEFAVFAPGADAETVRPLIERAMERLAAHRPPVRLSCGIASSRIGLRTASDLLRAADAAMYTAKRTGRGRVVIAEPDPKGLTRSSGRPGARRARRDGLEVDSAALIAQGLRLLDGPLRAAPPLERLEGLATSLGATLRAAAAAISLCTHGGAYIETLFQLDLRSGHSSGVRQGVDGARYALDEYPRTAELLAGGGSLHVYAGDGGADAAERALLGELGMADVLLAAAADGRGSWLLEMYGDAQSADLSLVDGALRLLCDHAVRPASGLRTERRATASLRAVP
jgi:diguanylate cyclase (GGDEF)-like protein